MNAARQAGLSKDQTINAIRVHRVSREELEEAVESDDPPTIASKGGRPQSAGGGAPTGKNNARNKH
jgi:hypothetical protein